MKERKKNYSPDFKTNAVMLSFGKESIDKIAQKLQISSRTLLHWRKSYVIFGESFALSGKIKLSADQEMAYNLKMQIKKLDTEFAIITGAANCKSNDPKSIFQYISENEQYYSKYQMCKILSVNLGSYNKWKNEYISERQKWRMKVKEEIAAIFNSSQQRYGSKRITAELQKSGCCISSNTVLLYMRAMHLHVSVKKKHIKKNPSI